MLQYNNTLEARKVFAEDFDFGVPSQGWQDYSRRETDPDRCERHKQWMLFRPKNRTVRKRLYSGIDYDALAHANTTCVPGFRKGDVVRVYEELFG